ncbi:MAG: hypothetical protein ACPLKZ_05095 [Candidatus Bathyarchaeales archaeon]
MAISRKSVAAAFSLLLLFAATISLMTFPATGQRVGSQKTYPFIGATPNPVGVGQETLLHIGITQQLQITQDGWTGITVTVTKPDGSTERLGPFRTDSTGGTGYTYIPSMPGTYKLQTHFPGQWYNFTAGGQQYRIYFEASDSAVLELVVLPEPVPIYPGVPLPTEYWTRPVDAQFREWKNICGNWLGIYQFGDTLAGSIEPGNEDAPETAHVLWTKPLEEGGLVGAPLGDYSYFCGDAYEGKFSGTVIINGKVFYNKFNTIGGTAVDNYVVAVDIHTGEELWKRALIPPNGTRQTLSFGQVMEFNSFNVQGAFAYLWTSETVGTVTNWHAFDITDGRWLFTMTNIPGGSTVVGPMGELIRYQINQAAGWMTMWNSTAVISAYWGTNPNSPQWGSWRPQGKVINATGPVPVTPATPLGLNGYQWNKTIPIGLPGSPSYYIPLDLVIGYYRDTYGFGGEAFGNPPFTIWAISLKPGEEGRLLYNKTYNVPPGNVTVGYTRVGVKDRVFVVHMKELCTNYCYNLDTGEYMWGPTEPPEHYLSYLETWTVIHDGKVYTHGTKGIVDCYDAKTGKKLWSYEAYDPYNEILWSNNWNIRVDFIVDGKIYLRHSAHSDNNPLPRGAPYVCLNASTGEVIWRVNGLVRGTDWGGRGFIGDSIIVKMDTYDLLIFAIGKGPSATSVSASPKVSTHGSKVLVEGMVTDISPGTKSPALAMRFPNGVPAVADESMSDWMLYVYKQFPRPTDVKGVEVIVEVFDPNKNFYEVGRTTSDDSGFFRLTFEPPVPGEYTVIARFPGSKAYYGSFAKTAIYVEEAPPAPEATPTPASMTDAYVLGFGLAAIIAIVAIGLVIILMLRKR